MLIDANIIMYAAGAEHPYKRPSTRLLERVALGELEAAIDVEILQEILHRYRAINRWGDGRQVYDLTRQLFPSVIPITSEVLDRARQLLDTDVHLMARDALHAAVAIAENLTICSYDQDFDRIPGLRRQEPDAWPA